MSDKTEASAARDVSGDPPDIALKNKGFFGRTALEIDSVIARDPAARGRLEIILCYPSFHAVMGYRVAHWLWERKWRLLGRWISQVARWLTGIEIHPGATIGRNLFIDHGMGVVIGEASVIGDNVTMYHGVTLGGVSPSEDSSAQRSQKRHPTIDDDVIIGSGAAILGPVHVGHCARVGSNAVVVKDVPAKVSVVGIPAKAIHTKANADNKEAVFAPYGTPIGDDWTSETDKTESQMLALLEHIHGLELRLGQLENSEANSAKTANSAKVAKKPKAGKVNGEKPVASASES